MRYSAPASPHSLRVIIADDHPSALMLVSCVVRQYGGQVACVSANGDDLFEAACSGVFNLLVTDLVMPGDMPGLSLLRAIRHRCEALPVIVYTAIDTPIVARILLDAGVSACVSKASPSSVLLTAIKAVAGGATYVDPSIDMAQAESHPWLALSPSERRVTIAVLNGMSLKAIALQSGRSYSTVSAQKYSAQEKLGAKTDADLVGYLHHTGLVHVLTWGR